jgi:hypothetical protein
VVSHAVDLLRIIEILCQRRDALRRVPASCCTVSQISSSLYLDSCAGIVTLSVGRERSAVRRPEAPLRLIRNLVSRQEDRRRVARRRSAIVWRPVIRLPFIFNRVGVRIVGVATLGLGFPVSCHWRLEALLCFIWNGESAS